MKIGESAGGTRKAGPAPSCATCGEGARPRWCSTSTASPHERRRSAVPHGRPHRLRPGARGAQRRRAAAGHRGRRAPRGDPGPRQGDAGRRLPHNIMSTHNVFAAARAPRHEEVVWASSETMLGLPFDTPPPYAPVDEELPRRPETTYSLAKAVERGDGVAVLPLDPGIPIVGLRLSNVMEPEDYVRFPVATRRTRRLRKWNLWGYIDARDGAQAVRRRLEPTRRRRGVRHRRRGHRDERPTPRAGRARSSRACRSAAASTATRRCCRSTRRAGCSATQPGYSWRELPASCLNRAPAPAGDGMDYVRLGRTGLEVSRIVLGCMSVRRPARATTRGRSTRTPAGRSSGARSRPASSSSTRPTSTPTGRARRSSAGRCCASTSRARRSCIATKVTADAPGPNGARPVAQGDHDRDRRVARAARHGLRRPLPDPPLGPGTRRSRRRWRRCTTW